MMPRVRYVTCNADRVSETTPDPKGLEAGFPFVVHLLFFWVTCGKTDRIVHSTLTLYASAVVCYNQHCELPMIE